MQSSWPLDHLYGPQIFIVLCFKLLCLILFSKISFFFGWGLNIWQGSNCLWEKFTPKTGRSCNDQLTTWWSNGRLLLPRCDFESNWHVYKCYAVWKRQKINEKVAVSGPLKLEIISKQKHVRASDDSLKGIIICCSLHCEIELR